MSTLNPRVQVEQEEFPEKSQIYEELESLRGYIFYFVRRKISIYPDYEDVVSDIYLSCLSSLDSYRGNCALKTWVYRIMFRRIVDYIRLKQKRNECGLEDTYEHLLYPSPGEVVIEQNEKDELKERVFSCFPVLSGQQQRVFGFLLSGLTRAEIAKTMHIGHRTVTNYYALGLIRLRRAI